MALGFIRLAPAGGSQRGGLVSVAWPGGRNLPFVGQRNRGAVRGSKRAPQGDPIRGSARSGRWRKVSNRPVLKHGPRSLTCMRVGGWKTHEAQEN